MNNKQLLKEWELKLKQAMAEDKKASANEELKDGTFAQTTKIIAGEYASDDNSDLDAFERVGEDMIEQGAITNITELDATLSQTFKLIDMSKSDSINWTNEQRNDYNATRRFKRYERGECKKPKTKELSKEAYKEWRKAEAARIMREKRAKAKLIKVGA